MHPAELASVAARIRALAGVIPTAPVPRRVLLAGWRERDDELTLVMSSLPPSKLGGERFLSVRILVTDLSYHRDELGGEPFRTDGSVYQGIIAVDSKEASRPNV